MSNTYSTLYPVLQRARRRYLDTLEGLAETELPLRLADGSNSIGFLIRHNAEVEYRFCANYFGRELPTGVVISAVGNVKDEGNFTDLASLLAFGDQSYQFLLDSLAAFPEEKWHDVVDAPIGAMSPLEAVGRLIFHTSYHGGQIGLIRKYAPGR